MSALIVAVLAAVWLPTQAFGQDAAFSFMGHSIGDSFSKWRGKLEVNDTLSWCKKPDSFGIRRCKDNSLAKEGSYGKIGPLSVDWLNWDFLDDKLIGFQLAAYKSEYTTIFDMTSSKYGPASFIGDCRALWYTEHGPMDLYCEKVNTTPYVFLELRDQIADTKISERKDKLRQARGAQGQKLF